MELELRHLRVVVAIAEHGSIGAAARSLGIAQAALSAQLKRVERVTGCRLFTRLPHGIRPTRAGELVVERARSTLDDLGALSEDLDDLSAPVGTLLVGGITSDWFARFLARAIRALPHGLLSSTDDSTTTLDEWLATGHVDVAMVAVHGEGDEAAPPGCEQLPVVDHQPYLVALGAGHPLAQSREVALEELAETPWLLPRGRPDGTMPAFLGACRRAGFEPSSPVGPADLSFYVTWVAEHGAACLCSPAYPPAPGIVVVPLRDEPVTSRIVIRWRPERVTDDVVELLRVELASAYVDQVRVASERQPWWDAVPAFRPRLAEDLAARVPGL